MASSRSPPEHLEAHAEPAGHFQPRTRCVENIGRKHWILEGLLEKAICQIPTVGIRQLIAVKHMG
jgi:hypothetical protein